MLILEVVYSSFTSGLVLTLPVQHPNSGCLLSLCKAQKMRALLTLTFLPALCLCWHPTVILSERNPTHLSACLLLRQLRKKAVLQSPSSGCQGHIDACVKIWQVLQHFLSFCLSPCLFLSLQQQSLKAKEATEEMELSILKTCQSVSDLRREVRFLWRATHRDLFLRVKDKTEFLLSVIGPAGSSVNSYKHTSCNSKSIWHLFFYHTQKEDFD